MLAAVVPPPWRPGKLPPNHVCAAGAARQVELCFRRHDVQALFSAAREREAVLERLAADARRPC